MTAIITLIVCLSGQPHVCETVNPALTHMDGTPLTYFECLTSGGQSVAHRWLAEHPGYTLKRVQCTVSNGTPERTYERLLSPQA